MKAVKQFEILEDGCLKLTLSSKKEYDPYMLSLIEKEANALSCRSKKASSTIFYYDTCEHIPLSTLLSKYEFDEKEACICLENLFHQLADLTAEYPLLIRFDAIYYDPLRQTFSFVILPIHKCSMEYDWTELLSDVIASINLRKEAFYGFLCSLKHKQLSPSQIAEQCRLWQLQHTFLKRLIAWVMHLKRRRLIKKQNEQRLHEELIRLRFIHRSSDHEISHSVKNRQSSDTVVLFPESGGCLKDLRGNIYPLQQETHIGRNDKNDIVIENAAVSAYHAVIKQSGQGMKLIDLGSSNGTRLNNKKLKKHQEAALKSGDTILFADSCWHYEEDTL